MHDALAAKLEDLRKRHAELETLMADQAQIADQTRYRALVGEYASLSRIITRYRSYLDAERQANEARDLAAAESDRDLAALAREEENTQRARAAALQDEIESILLTEDDMSAKRAIVEIRAGVGGDEAGIFAGDLFRMYGRYAERMGWTVEIVDMNRTEGVDGLKEITFTVEGEGAFSDFRYESGTHRVQRVPETEAQGRIHTSAATVAVLPEAEEVDIDIRREDLIIDRIRSGGPGGQNVNKTSSAIRLHHKPSGLIVHCQVERSQHRNLDLAMRLLRSRLYEMEAGRREAERGAMRRSQVGTGDRSERIRTYNFPQNRVTDHRAGITIYDLQSIMDGDLGPLVKGLKEWDKAEKLKRLGAVGAPQKTPVPSGDDD